MFTLDSIMDEFMELLVKFSVWDFFDIVIIAYICYKMLIYIKDTRAEQLLKGIIALLVLTEASSIFKLHTIHWILVKILEVGFILPFIIFQPELRAGLEHIGRNKWLSFMGSSNLDKSEAEVKHICSQIVEESYELASKRIGALLVIEGETKLNEIVITGTKIDSYISKQLLGNIFIPNTPLHDGAVIIRDLRIEAAACFLPLTDKLNLSKELGTRHRAGIGISEVSDCLTIIVSEETGGVSIASSGKIYRDVPQERLQNILLNFYMTKKIREEKSMLKGIFKKF